MTALDLHNCCIGTVSSKEDGSVSFRVTTAELRPSEKGSVMDFHGKACRVAIFPHEGEYETVEVTTERGQKTPSQRLHAIFFIMWKQAGREGDFDAFYRQQMEKLIEHYKTKLNPI